MAGLSVAIDAVRSLRPGVKDVPKRWVLLAVGAVALVVALAVGLWSRGVSLYEQERGGRLVDRALELEGYETEKESWPLVWEPLTAEDALPLAEEAAERFRAAVAADPDHAQARRWLGRAALLVDEPLAAAEAFSAYVERRPNNPLAYWELGLAYEAMARRLEGRVHWALEPGAGLADPVFATGAVTESLEAAVIETPDVFIGTPYCDEEEGPASCFVGTTRWWMPDAPREGLWTPEEGVTRDVVYMHPPADATFAVTLPTTPTVLSFWMGIDPVAHGWLGDGVVYEVSVEGREVFTHALTAEEARQGWQMAQVDLGAWAAREVALTLATDAGPAGDGQGDWAGWGDVLVVERDRAAFVAGGGMQRARAVWEAG